MDFKPIPNYETYGISIDGTIKDFRTGKSPKIQNTPDGYIAIYLRNPDGNNRFLIHRLVALNYLDKSDNLLEVDHIDRNKTNNHVSNLRWVNDCIQSQNRAGFKNAKIPHKYITLEQACHDKYKCHTSSYRIQITQNYKKIYSKRFATSKYTLEDVIKIRDNYCLENNIVII